MLTRQLKGNTCKAVIEYNTSIIARSDLCRFIGRLSPQSVSFTAKQKLLTCV
jgi:hypothetical protein